MKKVLILCAHRPGRSPSQRYRFEQYLAYLESEGFTFEFSFLLNEKDDRLFYGHGNLPAKLGILAKTAKIRFHDMRRFNRFDIIFIQREAIFLGTAYFEKKAFRSGAKVIFDFDDSIWLPDTSPANIRWEWLKRPSKFFVNIKNAHHVIAGNEYLAAKAKQVNPHVTVIPTTVDTSVHFPMPQYRRSGTVTIGWSGSLSTIKHFELIVPVLKKIKEKFNTRVRFKILGPAGYRNPNLDIESVAWSQANEVTELNTFDIGIMPLPDDEWALGKCGLKGLTYMACAIPTVMTAVGVNNTIIRQGENGFTVTDEEDWINALSTLVENGDLREKLGENGRRTVVERYSVEANKTKYLAVLSGTIQ